MGQLTLDSTPEEHAQYDRDLKEWVDHLANAYLEGCRRADARRLADESKPGAAPPEPDNAIAVCEHPPEMRLRRDEDDWVCDGCGTWFDGATGTLIGHDDGPPDSF